MLVGKRLEWERNHEESEFSHIRERLVNELTRNLQKCQNEEDKANQISVYLDIFRRLIVAKMVCIVSELMI